MRQASVGDPEIETRINAYELAYRMQTSVPELTDISDEPQAVHDLYGTQPGQTSFANNCLLARRLVERGVRFVQLYHRGWDTHGASFGDDVIEKLPHLCRQTDQAAAALVKDLKQRGLLDTTLVVWGGEFGRTPMNEARNGSKFLGRDHHPRAFTMWMAGGGIKPGITYGETDELGYNITQRSGRGARPARHDAAPARHRPREADVPLPGPRLPPHRRQRQGGHGAARLRRGSRIAGSGSRIVDRRRPTCPTRVDAGQVRRLPGAGYRAPPNAEVIMQPITMNQHSHPTTGAVTTPLKDIRKPLPLRVLSDDGLAALDDARVRDRQAGGACRQGGAAGGPAVAVRREGPRTIRRRGTRRSVAIMR